MRWRDGFFRIHIVSILAATALAISLGTHAAETAPQEGWHRAAKATHDGYGGFVTVPQRDGSGWLFYRMNIYSKKPPQYYVIRLDKDGRYLNYEQVAPPPATPTAAGGSIDPFAQFR
jgi:hypothetical protein